MPVTEVSLLAASEAAMVDTGRRLASLLVPGVLVFLHGELGAGKTTLTRGIARALGHVGAVKSPTYTLVEPYLDLATPLYHFDLYRLGDPQELELMGVRDYFSGQAIAIIEWPERGDGFLPVPDLDITIAVHGETRELRLKACSDAGRTTLHKLQEPSAD
jgi:tRNA threonylcarbamoyladenosine biosynthesis protein TsaE